nr:hypothetical protein [Escherichia coli]UNB12903.1 hypothetical protein [Escherichia coli]UNJ80742.1 hypothetical protein [Escherichia coli]
MKNDYFIKVCIWYKAYSPAENTVSILSGLYAENGLPVCIKFQAMTQMLIPLNLCNHRSFCSSFSTEGRPTRFPASLFPIHVTVFIKARSTREDKHRSWSGRWQAVPGQ